MTKSKWLFTTINKYILLYLLSFVLMIFEAITNILMPDTLKKIIDVAIPYKDTHILFEKIILLLIIFIVSALSTILLEYIFSNIGNKLMFDIKMDIVNSLFNYFGLDIKEKHDKMMTVLMSDIYAIEQVITRRFSSFIIDIICITAIVVYLLYTNVTMTIIIILSYPILIVAQIRFNNIIKSKMKGLVREYDKTNTNIKELLTNLYEYVAYNGRQYFLNKFKPVESGIVNMKIDLNLIFSYNSILPAFLSSMTLLLIIGIGAFYVIDNILSIGELTIFYIYTNRVFGPVARIVLFFAELEKTKISLDRIYNLISIKT